MALGRALGVMAGVTLGVFVCAPGSAQAQVRVATPAGWAADATVPPAALAEADAWASATGLEVAQVASPDEQDGFSENLVVLQDRRPLHVSMVEDEAASLGVLTELATQLFDASAPPVSHGFVESGSSVVMQARWEDAGVVWDLVLAPAGAEHALIVLKTSSSNRGFHGRLIDDITAELSGVEKPIREFPRSIWRWSLVGFWSALAVAAHLVALGMSEGSRDQLAASRKSSLALIVLAIAATGVSYLLLADEGASLALAQTTRLAVALETLAGGVLVSVLLALLGRWLGAGPGRVDSAPRTGAFSTEAAPSGRSRTLARPRANPQSPIPRRLGPDADADVGAVRSED